MKEMGAMGFLFPPFSFFLHMNFSFSFSLNSKTPLELVLVSGRVGSGIKITKCSFLSEMISTF